MTIVTATTTTVAATSPSAVALRAAGNAKASAPVARPGHRPRDFGVGYGNSSGYASGRRYTCEWVTPRFRMT